MVSLVDRDDLLELRTCFENALTVKGPKVPKKAQAVVVNSIHQRERAEPNLSRADFNAGLDQANFYVRVFDSIKE
jgi:hypothetical protein